MKLKEGEHICHKCDGKGSWYEETEFGDLHTTCTWCWGNGKVDWIENVVGVQNPFVFDSSSITVSLHSSQPPSAQPGDLFIDNTDSSVVVLMQYDGQKWNVVEDVVT